MAEFPERPGTPSTPDPVPPGLQVPPTAITAIAPRETTSEGEPYRPLSLLAIAGFCVSALFTAILLLIAAVALLRQFPLYYPMLLVFPVGGLALSLAGLLRIQHSEGTMAGGKLALWGAFLGLLTTLTYSGYLMAITMVIRQQSIDMARTWLGELSNGEIERAFNLCLSPEGRSRKEGAALRDDMEEHNRADQPTKPGPMTEFSRANYVQFLRNGGPETKINSIGVHDWDYSEGGYKVHIECELVTREATAILMVGLFGTSRPGSPGRDWTMLPKETHLMAEVPGGFKGTPYGELIHRLRRDDALKFVTSWHWDLYHQRTFAAYLATRPANERPELKKRMHLAVAARVASGLAAPGVLIPDDPSWYLPGFHDFAEGKYCVTEPKDFFVSDPKVRNDENQRRSQVEAARRAVREGRFLIDPAIDATSTRKGDVLTVEFNLSLLLPPNNYVEGAIFVETDAAALDRGEMPKTWRIADVKFYRNRTVMMMPGSNMRPPPFMPTYGARPLPTDD